MRVDIADATPIQRLPFNERQHLAVLGNAGLRQILQRADDCGALSKTAERQFADHEGVAEYPAVVQQIGKRRIART